MLICGQINPQKNSLFFSGRHRKKNSDAIRQNSLTAVTHLCIVHDPALYNTYVQNTQRRAEVAADFRDR